jgi:hypothetical protein
MSKDDSSGQNLRVQITLPKGGVRSETYSKEDLRMRP